MISLDILIPTFNRCQPLIKNLTVLEEILAQIKDANINILVSDNASTDGTQKAVRNCIADSPNRSITLFSQKENVGFTKNVISCVERSKADYILILGDDDYISIDYLKTSVNSLRHDREISCILPAFEAITEKGERLGFGRDLGMRTREYEPGIDNIIDNSFRAHQISGIIIKRDGLYEGLVAKKITNLYPQIFMVALSCLRGRCVHIPEYPVLVTQTSNKAWRYDDVGLINDIFQNYNALGVSDKDQFRMERKIIRTQTWRALRYWKNPFKQMKVIYQIANGPYTSKRGRFLFPPILIYYWIQTVLAAIKRKIKDLCR